MGRRLKKITLWNLKGIFLDSLGEMTRIRVDVKSYGTSYVLRTHKELIIKNGSGKVETERDLLYFHFRVSYDSR